MNNCPIPFDRSYWVVPGQLMAGCYPGSPDPTEATRKLTYLIKSGIRHVINLMETDETGHNGEPFVPYENMLCNLAASHKTSVTFGHSSFQMIYQNYYSYITNYQSDDGAKFMERVYGTKQKGPGKMCSKNVAPSEALSASN